MSNIFNKISGNCVVSTKCRRTLIFKVISSSASLGHEKAVYILRADIDAIKLKLIHYITNEIGDLLLESAAVPRYYSVEGPRVVKIERKPHAALPFRQ